MRKASIFLILSLAFFSHIYSQTTTNCLEIENILVAACGTPEGDNEMVRILVGPNPLTVSNINVTWPPTSGFAFLGWRMDASTAAKTQQINATITSCGYVLEPLNGVIPANKKAIIITSYTASPTANSFANLADTIYVLYQNSTGRIAGHFANYNSSPGIRPLTLTYQSCTENVSYDRSLLVNAAGAYVAFTQSGTPTYAAGGCSAPITPLSVDAGNNPAAVCPGGTVSLAGSINGVTTFQQWSGGTGVFSAPNNENTNYTLNASQTGSFWLYLKVKGACADTLKDSVLITVQPQNPLQISASGPLSICTGDNLTLTATGGGSSYQWVGGPSTAQYTVNAPGTYTVQSSDACYNYQQSVVVTAAAAPTVSIAQSNTTLCPGATLTLTATSSGTVSWNNGTSGASTTVNGAGTYIATVTNGCGTASDSVTITAGQAPSAIINSPNPTTFCSGSDVQLTGNGSGTLTWSNGTTGNTTTVSQGGTYFLISQTSCGVDSASVLVTAIPITAQFTANPTTGNAPLTVNLTNQSTGADGQWWDFGNGQTSTDTNPGSVIYTDPGTYTVTLAVTNALGCVDTVSLQITVGTQMTVELPNIFTPNGDLVNDVYLIKALGVSSMKAEIYNRWGQIMFSWSDPNIAWDGKSTLGAPASPGVYFCVVEAIDAMGEKHVFKTTVTLIQ